jgi:hypothetical protein
LTLVRRFEPGAALIIELADRVGQDPVLRTATVVYVAPLPSGWALGCKFDTPLDEELLAALLQPPAPPPAANSPVDTRPTAAQAFWSGAGSTRGATPPS